MNYNTHMIARDEHKHMTESLAAPQENDFVPAQRQPVKRLLTALHIRPAIAAIINLIVR